MSNKGFKLIQNDKIIRAFEESTRQYLVGDLKKPQLIQHFKDVDIEIGITKYDRFQFEAPHYHTSATEYQYMLDGLTEYLDLETNETFVFKKGDFYKINPYTHYTQRSKEGTSILFIKSPGLNDKVNLEITDNIRKWADTPFPNKRTDYYYADNAPTPNSIRPAAAVAIFNQKNEILLIERRDNGKWSMPGGTLDFGESLVDCAIREVHEETNLTVNITDIIGTYTDPNVRVEYSDGEVRQEFTIVYHGETDDNDVQLDIESTKYAWVSLDRIFELEFASSQKRRIEDVIAYKEKGKKSFL